MPDHPRTTRRRSASPSAGACAGVRRSYRLARRGTWPAAAYADLADLPIRAAGHARQGQAGRESPGPDAREAPGWRARLVRPGPRSLLSGRAMGEVALSGRSGLDAGASRRRLTKQVLLFAGVKGRPGETRLSRPTRSMARRDEGKALPWSPARLYAPVPRARHPARSVHVPGTLARRGGTQIFLATANGERRGHVCITGRRTGAHGAYRSRVVGDSRPPRRETRWSGTAGLLPAAHACRRQQPSGHGSRPARAEADYRMVLG
jgi:hypothetical protein